MPVKHLELRASPRVLSADWQGGRRRSVLLAIFGIAAVAYSIARDHSLGSWALALGITGALIVAPGVAATLRARLAVSSGVVEYRVLLGRSHRTKVTDIRRIVRVRIEVLGPRFPFTRLLLLDASDHTRLSIQEEWWKASDLVAFQLHLGLQAEDSTLTITPRRANQLYPGAASFGRPRLACAAAVAARVC